MTITMQNPKAPCSVYWIKHVSHTDVTCEGYVGVSSNTKKRFGAHKRTTENAHLTHAINKYGWDNLEKTILVVSDKAYCFDLERKLRPENKIGWNIAAGGGNPPVTRWNQGKRLSDETRKKISAAVTTAMQDPVRREMNRGRQLGNTYRRGVALSTETIKKISASKMGQVSSRKGTKLSKEQRDNMKEVARACHWECPHCLKIGYSQGAATRWHFDNCKQKEF